MIKIFTFLLVFSLSLFAQPYPEPTSDFGWSGAQSTVSDIENAFNTARANENTMGLAGSVTLPQDLNLPDQTVWDAKSNSEKALFLINAERVARGLLPFEAVSNNIVNIAQNYADFLRTNNLFGHSLNGSPSDRLNSDPSISGCSESGWIFGPENLSNFGSTSPTPTSLPIERAVYGWIYEDASDSWGHRNTCFALFNNNFGSASNEGFIGVGYSEGSYTFFGDPFNFGAVVVFNFVDPCPSSPLPVELTSFTINLSGNNIELNWETATEVNNYGFEIEKLKSNLINKDSEWEKIGFVEGHGNSNSPNYYSFKDKIIEASGKYSYRLKQIDIDGAFEYSGIVETNLGLPQNFELRQNYPNPFNPVTAITYSIPNEGHVELGIYDILGNTVEIIENEVKPAGVYTISFDASNLASGIYIYKIKTNNFISIKKMLLMK
ncbi:MAG: T9SS type A sorting domain-containing protein [Ignavibacteriae bacterium]|nr:T9SS type A sorting domain-containing protein [Ignavibacteriota bacterium]